MIHDYLPAKPYRFWPSFTDFQKNNLLQISLGYVTFDLKLANASEKYWSNPSDTCKSNYVSLNMKK